MAKNMRPTTLHMELETRLPSSLEVENQQNVEGSVKKLSTTSKKLLLSANVRESIVAFELDLSNKPFWPWLLEISVPLNR